jgi:hypothetical protein
LAWDFNINTSVHDHLWSVRIDAVNGIVRKNDLVISCNFHKEVVSVTESNFVLNTEKLPKQLFSPPHLQFQEVCVYLSPLSKFLLSLSVDYQPSNNLFSPFGWHDTDGVTGPEILLLEV